MSQLGYLRVQSPLGSHTECRIGRLEADVRRFR